MSEIFNKSLSEILEIPQKTRDGKEEVPGTRVELKFDSMLLYGPTMSIFRKNEKYFIGGIETYLQQKPREFFVNMEFSSEKDAKEALKLFQWICIITDNRIALNNKGNPPETLKQPTDNSISSTALIHILGTSSIKQSFERLKVTYPGLLEQMIDLIGKLPRG